MLFLRSSQCLLVCFNLCCQMGCHCYVRNSMIRCINVPLIKTLIASVKRGLSCVVLLHKLSYWLGNLYHVYLFSTTTLIEVISFWHSRCICLYIINHLIYCKHNGVYISTLNPLAENSSSMGSSTLNVMIVYYKCIKDSNDKVYGNQNINMNSFKSS